MTKTQALAAIDKAYQRLAGCCEHTHNWERYIAQHAEEESQHRRFKPGGLVCGLTRAQSVRLFAVKHVFERFVPGQQGEASWTPEAKDWFHIKPSVFGACSIAHECQERILAEFRKPEMVSWLAQIDYVELNKDARELARVKANEPRYVDPDGNPHYA